MLVRLKGAFSNDETNYVHPALRRDGRRTLCPRPRRRSGGGGLDGGGPYISGGIGGLKDTGETTAEGKAAAGQDELDAAYGDIADADSDTDGRMAEAAGVPGVNGALAAMGGSSGSGDVKIRFDEYNYESPEEKYRSRVVFSGKEQTVPRNTGHVFAENTYYEKLTGKIGKCGEIEYFGSYCRIPFRAEYTACNPDAPPYGLRRLFVELGFSNSHGNSYINGVQIADDDDRIRVEVDPVSMAVDGVELDYDFGGNLEIPVRNDYKAASTEDRQWTDVIPPNQGWAYAEFRFDVIIYAKEPGLSLVDGSIRLNLDLTAPYVVYVGPADGIPLRHEPILADGAEATPVGQGAGELLVTKIFYNLQESELPTDFYMEYSFSEGGGVTRSGTLLRKDGVLGSEDGHPSLTWTLTSRVLRLDANGGELDAETDSLRVDAIRSADPISERTFQLSEFGAARTASGNGTFLGWNTMPDGTGEDVDLEGDIYVMPEGTYEVTLYAQWERSDVSELPKTGGAGTGAYVAAGVALIVVAGVGAAWYAARKKDDGGDPLGGAEA